jgi:glycosyltransferase involved in cell wall biosynthesis
MDLTFVGHRCCDHSPSSGYDQIAALFPESGWLDGPALEAGRVEWTQEASPASTGGRQIFHVIYGDCSGKELPKILKNRFPGAVVVSSVHQPVAQLLADGAALEALHSSNAILTVSQTQARELENLGIGPPIYTVPHGVWTRIFRPPAGSPVQGRQTVLFVGSFLRDWPGARRILALLSHVGIRSIGLGDGARRFLADADLHIELPPRVSESELARLYDRAAAVCLPFLNATASNALLEAMAAGCPIICPSVPSLVDEYLGDDSDTYPPGDYETAAARILHYVENPVAREARKSELTSHASAFDWSALKPRYIAAYAEVEAVAPAAAASGSAS